MINRVYIVLVGPLFDERNPGKIKELNHVDLQDAAPVRPVERLLLCIHSKGEVVENPGNVLPRTNLPEMNLDTYVTRNAVRYNIFKFLLDGGEIVVDVENVVPELVAPVDDGLAVFLYAQHVFGAE